MALLAPSNSCHGIPLQNIWLLMLYASDFRYQAYQYADNEKVDEHVADLVTEVLCKQVSQRLQRQLSFGYRHTEAQLNRVRGRIDVLETSRKMLLFKGKVACRFEELSINTPRNQYIVLALSKSLNLVKEPTLRCTAQKLLDNLRSSGVDLIPYCSYRPQNDRFSRHEMEDQKIIATAELIHNLALITESVGQQLLPNPDKQEHWVRKLFEKAVYGFYGLYLSNQWAVSASKKLAWQIEEMTDNIKMLLPRMELDIQLENTQARSRIVIDTKFTSITKTARFGGETYKSSYIYQLFAYLRSQENPLDPLSLNSEGILLHPSAGISHRESVLIQGHKIRFCTVDLSDSSKNIRQELLDIITRKI